MDDEQDQLEPEADTSWTDDYSDDGNDSVRDDIGYREAPVIPIQSRLQGLPFAPGATKAHPPAQVSSGGVCASCGKSYAIRMLGECPYCQGRRTRQAADALASVIRELKAGRAAPDRERHLMKQLRELGHPHIAELLASIEARNQSAVTKPRSRL